MQRTNNHVISLQSLSTRQTTWSGQTGIGIVPRTRQTAWSGQTGIGIVPRTR